MAKVNMSRADNQFENDEWLACRSQHFYKIMVVEFNTGGANFIPVQQASTPRTKEAASSSSSSSSSSPSADSPVSFSSQAIQQTLQQSAQSRPDKVAQASALVSDTSYPSDTALNQLAGFFAARL